jgi:putative membrane protein
MLNAYGWLTALHVIGNLVWIGSILSVGLVLTSRWGSPEDRGRLARKLYLTLATPGFALALLAGLVRLLLSLELYLVHTRYMHAKLFLALIAIAVHHVLGARARAMRDGRTASAGGSTALSLSLLLCAAGAAVLVVLKPF